MNEFLESRFVENVKRLALGLEPVDAGRGGRIAHPIHVILHESAQGLPRPTVERHDSCLHALLYQPGVADRVNLRFYEQSRRFVPRLISYPILTVDQADALDYRNRVRRPVLFPGAAYGVVSGHTGIRGRVERAGVAVRWARVEATREGGGPVVGRAMSDDRGEFLLLIGPEISPVGDLEDPLHVRVDAFGPPAAPAPNPPSLPNVDSLWDLPLEQAQTLDPNDPETDAVSAGEVRPSGFTATADRVVNVRLGRMHSEEQAFVIS